MTQVGPVPRMHIGIIKIIQKYYPITFDFFNYNLFAILFYQGIGYTTKQRLLASKVEHRFYLFNCSILTATDPYFA